MSVYIAACGESFQYHCDLLEHEELCSACADAINSEDERDGCYDREPLEQDEDHEMLR